MEILDQNKTVSINVKLLSFLCLTFISFFCISQNLVNNYSFENYKSCPQILVLKPTDFNTNVKEWNVPSFGTTDYFNRCSNHEYVGVPKNQFGIQEPHTGNAYIGLLNEKRGYREYIQIKLKESLKRNKAYCVEFWVSLSEYSVYGIKDIGALFSNDEILIKSDKNIEATPQIMIDTAIMVIDRWVKISGVFKAKGGEQYLIIGSFSNNKKDFKKTGRKQYPKKKVAYYYLDDVCVIPIHKGENCNCEVEAQHQDTVKKDTNTFAPGKPIILPDITFMVNKWDLQNNVKPLLDSLSNYLKEHKKYKLIISGHTDNTGTEQYNQMLSEQRAKSVKEYLITKGIASERIETKGYGSKQPVSDNNTELGRSKNRRVEIMIIE